MGDWSDNGLSMTLKKKLRMLPLRMSLIYLTRYGVSKVFIDTSLLGRLDPIWAIILESPQSCASSLKVAYTFLLHLNLSSICAQRIYLFGVIEVLYLFTINVST